MSPIRADRLSVAGVGRIYPHAEQTFRALAPTSLEAVLPTASAAPPTDAPPAGEDGLQNPHEAGDPG